MPIPYDYIFSFLAQMEGEHRRGYVPCHVIVTGKGRNYIGCAGTPACGIPWHFAGAPELVRAMGASGVTIGIGCDLGQTSAATLQAYGVPAQLIQTFALYLGKRRAAALAALHAAPLLISAADCHDLSLAVITGYINSSVIPAYDKRAVKPFASLPKEAQAVIASCCYQKGCAGVRRDWPMLWSHLTACNWKLAEQELRFGFRQYRTRRRAEADKLHPLNIN